MKSSLWLFLLLFTCNAAMAQTILPGDDAIAVRQKLIKRVRAVESKRPIWQQDFFGQNKPPETRSNYELLRQIMKESNISEGEVLTILGGKKSSAPTWYHPALLAGIALMAITSLMITIKLTGALRAVQAVILSAFVFASIYPPWNAQLLLGQPLGYAPIYAPPEGIVYLDFVRLAVEWIMLGVVMFIVSRWENKQPSNANSSRVQSLEKEEIKTEV